jgi:hypothetical protein
MGVEKMAGDLPFEYHTRVGEFAKALLGVDQLTDAQQAAVERWNNNDQHLEEYLKRERPAGGGSGSVVIYNQQWHGETVVTVAPSGYTDIIFNLNHSSGPVDTSELMMWGTFTVEHDGFAGEVIRLSMGGGNLVGDTVAQFDNTDNYGLYQVSITGVWLNNLSAESRLRIYNDSADHSLYLHGDIFAMPISSRYSVELEQEAG